ncbi:MAG: right-handed parallel beta-helix repeat-containing protein [Bacteroidota bacterium]
MQFARITLSTIYLFFFIVSSAQDTLWLKDYIEKYKDFSLSTYKALEKCREYEQAVLMIPAGTHDFYPDQAFEKYCRITNNTNGQKRVAFPLIDQHGLTIIGNQANIILHGLMIGMLIHESSDIKIQDLSFDWAKPFYLQAIVEAVDKKKQTYILKIEEEEEFDIINDDLVVKRAEAEYFIGSNFWFDPVSRAPVYNLLPKRNRHWNPYKSPHYQLERLDEHRIKVTNRIDTLPEVGWHFIAKWRNQPNINRTAPAIHLQDAQNIQLHQVSIYSAAGMGIIGEKSENIALQGIKVMASPDSDRIVSTTADATHFVNCKGLVKLEDCLFQSCLDDGLNIHGNYATIHSKINERKLLAEIVHVQQEGFVFATQGDTIQHIHPKTLLPFPDAQPLVVKSYKKINDQFFEIESEQALPNIKEGEGLDNLTWSADLVMKNCRIEKNWARGILLKTYGRLLVENNYIAAAMSGIRNWGEMNFFNESGRVKEVIIRKNTFKNVCRVGTAYPAIVIFPQVKKDSSTNNWGYYNQRIQITDNTFLTFDSGILFATSVKHLEFSKNLIIQSKDYPPLFPEKPHIEVRDCASFLFQGNTYTGDVKAKVELDKASILEVKILENKGFVE